MSEENPVPENDWHRLSRLPHLSWENLVCILFNLRFSYLKNLPDNCPAGHAKAAESMYDLLKWIHSDCDAGNLKCSNIDCQNPEFQINDIGRWLVSNGILVWLTKHRNMALPFRAEIIKFVEKIAYGHSAEPLKTNDRGELDGDYYASLSGWTLLLARQLIDEGNPGLFEKVTEAMVLSSRARDPLYHLMIIPPIEGAKPEAGLLLVYPVLFCMWADLKGFDIPANILEILEGHGMFEWARKKCDEFDDLQKNIKIKRTQQKDSKETTKPAQSPKIEAQEKNTTLDALKELKFHKVGKTWLVGFEEVKNIPSTKGMLYLQYLLLHPQEFFSGFELQALDGAVPSSIGVKSKDIEGMSMDELHQKEDQINSVEIEGQTLSLLEDLRAMKNNYEKAKEDGSADSELLEKEYMDCLEIYQSDHDIYGKPRDDSAPEKKAIKAVAKNIKTAKNNVKEYFPELAKIMDDIKTGNKFSYTPTNPDNPVKIITN